MTRKEESEIVVEGGRAEQRERAALERINR